MAHKKRKKKRSSARRRAVQRTVTTTRTERAVFKGFDEHVDNVFVAAEDGDCKRAWDHFERAEKSRIDAGFSPEDDTTSEDPIRIQIRTLKRLKKQLVAVCPSPSSGPTESRMGGLFDSGSGLWVLLGVAAGLAYVTFAKKPSREVRPEVPGFPGVIQGRVVSSQEVA